MRHGASCDCGLCKLGKKMGMIKEEGNISHNHEDCHEHNHDHDHDHEYHNHE